VLAGMELAWTSVQAAEVAVATGESPLKRLHQRNKAHEAGSTQGDGPACRVPNDLLVVLEASRHVALLPAAPCCPNLGRMLKQLVQPPLSSALPHLVGNCAGAFSERGPPLAQALSPVHGPA